MTTVNGTHFEYAPSGRSAPKSYSSRTTRSRTRSSSYTRQGTKWSQGKADATGSTPSEPIDVKEEILIHEDQLLLDWIGSADAAQYEGEWVALGPNLEVVDVASAPRDLPDADDITIVFIPPSDLLI